MKKITYKITNNTIKITNSYLVRSKEKMNLMLNLIGIETVFPRSKESLIKEWRAHNLMYDLGLFRSHTKDVDLNTDESKLRLFLYSVLSLFYCSKD